jgi:hypothetical protein
MGLKDLIGLAELDASIRQLEKRLQPLEKKVEGVTHRSDEQFQAVRRTIGQLTRRVDDYLEYSRRYGRPVNFGADEAFDRVASTVIEQGRTMLKYDRLYTLWQAVKNVRGAEAAAAEVGSFRGGSAYFIANAFLELTGRERPLHVFDTFEGHPEHKLTDFDAAHTADKFTDTSYDEVREYLGRFEQVSVHKGEFSESVKAVAEPSFSLVHIDVDLYQVTLDCLAYFGPRLVPGGVMVVDDYGAATCPGVAKAVHEHLGDGQAFQAWDMKTDQIVLVRR